MNKLILILTLLVLIPAMGWAQDISNKGSKGNLNGHYFIPLSVNRTPFTNTRIMMPLGFGQTSSFEFPIPIIGGDSLFGASGEILLATLGIQYRQQVRDWISFNMKVEVAARVGTDVKSLLIEGLDNVISFELGTMIKLHETKKTLLSTSLKLQNLEGNFVDINGFVQDLLDSTVNDPSISRTVPALVAGVGLHFAWGISPTFGFSSVLAASYGETFTRGNSDTRITFGGFIEADLNPKFKIPIGLSIGAFSTTEPEYVYVDDKSAQIMISKLSYTGRADFDLGIEIAKATIPFENTETRPSVDMVQLVMTYFFN